MSEFHRPFSGFSVDDTAKAKAFYAEAIADDVTAAVRELAGRGVEFARYAGMPQDDDGVMMGNGPDIAWFTDPAGNVFSVIAA